MADYENDVIVEEGIEEENGRDFGFLLGVGAIAGGAILAEKIVKKGIDLAKNGIEHVKKERAAKNNQEGKLEEVEVVEDSSEEEK